MNRLTRILGIATTIGCIAAAAQGGSGGHGGGMGGMGMGSPAPSILTGPIKVDKAKGQNAYTVEEVHAKGPDLDKKNISVKGVVIKVSRNIMGKNWIHLRDGSGDEAKGTNKLVVTSNDLPSVGDVVTAKGILANDKDFGAGYRYVVIMEDASFKP